MNAVSKILQQSRVNTFASIEEHREEGAQKMTHQNSCVFFHCSDRFLVGLSSETRSKERNGSSKLL